MEGLSLPRGLALLVAATAFMELLDASIVAPALPAMARELAVGPRAVNLVIAAYVVAIAAVTPVTGWLCQRWGTRPCFMGGIVVFTVASGAVCVADSLLLLTVLRLVQGVGGALMVPVGRVVVLAEAPKRELLRTIAYLTWPALAAPLLGPPIGGLLTTYASWRVIFAVNIPLGIWALVEAWRRVPVIPLADESFDWKGFLGLATGIGGLTVTLEWVSLGSPTPLLSVMGLAASCLVLAAATRHLRRATPPLLDVSLFRLRTFRYVASDGTVFRAATMASPLLLVLYFQLGLGWTPAKAGTTVVALYLGNVAVKPATSWIMRSVGLRHSIVMGAFTCGVSLGVVVTPVAATSNGVLVSALVVAGAGRSIGFTALHALAYVDVEERAVPQASTLLSTVQQVGTCLGLTAVAPLMACGPVVVALLGLASTTGSSFRGAVMLVAVLLVALAISALRLERSAGQDVVKRSREGD
jgi:MFS family permease